MNTKSGSIAAFFVLVVLAANMIASAKSQRVSHASLTVSGKRSSGDDNTTINDGKASTVVVELASLPQTNEGFEILISLAGVVLLLVVVGAVGFRKWGK